MRYLHAIIMALLLSGSTTLVAQEASSAPPELDVFKSEVGTWDVEIKAWTGPGEPTVTQGKEISRMLGDSWLLVDFEGKMMGLEFQGHGMYSYDPVKKHYVGTWVDSMSSRKMDMTGVHNSENQTMTYVGMAPGADGKLAKHELKTRYNGDGTRVMTMHVRMGERMVKVFEMNYAKSK